MRNYISISIIFVISFCLSSPVLAQGKMAITITPPLIKNNVNPGQIWKSYIKVVNNNAETINVYAELINFEAGNEAGTVELTPLSQETIEAGEYLINNWINIEEGPIEIPAYKSKDIPFIIDVPEKVDPGDHHLAILIGTEPSGDNEGGSSIKISSKIGSLLLLNVGGEVEESGIVREFSTDKASYSDGEISFALRFQNTGNTILQPRGEIRIYDWQEKDRGGIEINHKTNTGNVFPEDTRLWEYNWTVPTGIFDMGRYRADMIMIYGTKNAETIERSVYFWVIQWKPILITATVVMFFIFLIVIIVRRSIKKAVIRTQEQIGGFNSQIKSRPVAKIKNKPVVRAKPRPRKVVKKVVVPREVIDLKSSIKKDER